MGRAAKVNLEKDLLNSLAQSRKMIIKIKEKLGTGESISFEINQLKALAEDISKNHLLLLGRFRLRHERLKAMGPKAEKRHRTSPSEARIKYTVPTRIMIWS